MSNPEVLRIQPEKSDILRSSQDSCAQLRQEVLLEMRHTVGVNPPAADAVDVHEHNIAVQFHPEQTELIALMETYLKTRLHEYILRELASSGSATHEYYVAKNNIADVTDRLVDWAKGMGFAENTLEYITPERAQEIFDDVWNTISDTLTA